MKIIKYFIIILILLIISPYIIVKLYPEQKVVFPADNYVKENSTISVSRYSNDNNGYDLHKGSVNYKNQETDFLIIKPEGTDLKKLPVVFILNGFKYGKNIIEKLDYSTFLKDEFALLSIDYYFPYETTDLNITLNINKISKYTEKSMQLINCLLVNLNEVEFLDTENIFFVGASLGAFTGMAPVSNNSHMFSGISSVYAGADMGLIAEGKIPSKFDFFYFNYLIREFLHKNLNFADPANYINKFNNIPIQIIYGTHDRTIPVESSKKLIKSYTGNNLTAVELKGKHIGVDEKDLMQKTLSSIKKWVDENR
ncbi:MAG: prolyl oligopeptidase family serine peptidase [Candidatus Muiribacteriota bacterium]